MPADHFAAYHDEDLVRALTLERANYQDSYLASVAAELARRNVDPQAFIDQVEVRYHADAPTTCTIAQALAKASEELLLWRLLAFTRYFGDTLVVQRELRSYLVNIYRGEEYAFSFFVTEDQSLQDLLRRFLTLADWDHLAGTTYQLDSWQPLLRTRSPRYMQKIATALADEGLPFTVQTPVLSHDPRGQLTLLVPRHRLGGHRGSAQSRRPPQHPPRPSRCRLCGKRPRPRASHLRRACRLRAKQPSHLLQPRQRTRRSRALCRGRHRLCRSRILEPYCARYPSPIPVSPGYRRAGGDFRDGGDVDLGAQTGREDANR